MQNEEDKKRNSGGGCDERLPALGVTQCRVGPPSESNFGNLPE